LHDLFPWARPEEVARDETLQRRHEYMNAWAFAGRAIFFSPLWNLMARYLRKWSLDQDQTSDPAPTRKLRILSGPGIVSSIDRDLCLCGLDLCPPNHGGTRPCRSIVLIGQILIAYAFSVMLMSLFKRTDPLAGVVTRPIIIIWATCC